MADRQGPVMHLVECVPNFSEGRDTAVIDEICRCIAATDGVFVIDRQSDPDHNRSVVSFIGAPAAVEAAALVAADAATRLIDLARHAGAHPRVGALDILPFIPFRGIGVKATVALAHRVADALAATHQLPVYLYGQARRRDERERPVSIRRHAARLASDIGRDPLLTPDVGPAQLHPTAGAVLVGVRPLLVAFNVVLDGEDVTAARDVARVVRGSSGGVQGLQALGFALPSQNKVQVSMNLIDVDRVGLEDAHGAVAAATPLPIAYSELVGLVPAPTVNRAARAAYDVRGLGEDATIEQRLLGALLAPVASPLPLLERLASAAATPGGGAVVATSAALAAAQIAMLCRLARKQIPEDDRDLLDGLLARADAGWRELYGLIARDVAGFEVLMAAFRAGEVSAADREAAAAPPARVAAILEALLIGCELLADHAAPHLLPDLAIALRTALSAAAGAVDLVRINTEDGEGAAEAAPLLVASEQALELAGARCETLLQTIDSRRA